jgi:hypothetical protein
MSLDEYNTQNIEGSSVLLKSNTSMPSKIWSFLMKYKCYVIISVVVLIFLIVFKPGFIMNKVDVENKDEKQEVKSTPLSTETVKKINLLKLIKYWIIISVILFIIVYFKFFCKKQKICNVCST